ncbi:hypothetical protein M407DRAFT_244475 [Tulasnella calospora MUT 4182]|uniref:Transmembrane protein n=1 Tax=Tulasnella calospora MUT 4182 TaxID=1051891 RepID=A0A0C3KSI0_9AGAM|nr:hypothetical protein M407DRAFT_244475 [Tulasnella calospora MUT 4182]
MSPPRSPSPASDDLSGSDFDEGYSGIPLTPLPSQQSSSRFEDAEGGHPHPLLRSQAATKLDMEPFDSKEVTFMAIAATAVVALSTVAFSVTLLNLML